jgi:hypothetical protein
MLSPDKFFKDYHPDFPSQTRNAARKLFRRAVREYYVMRRRYVIDPVTDKRAERVFIGQVVQQQKTQRRLVKRYFSGKNKPGRPMRPEVKLLVARLFLLWGRYAKTAATYSWKLTERETDFEIFMNDLLPRLGASDVRRYIEAHWRERSNN